jgi:hypothetical protein
VIRAHRIDVRDVVARERGGGGSTSVTPNRSGWRPTGECTVAAKRWKWPDCMQPAANSCRVYSSESTVSADWKFKGPLAHSQLRRTGLMSGLSRPPPTRNPPVGRPGRQPKAIVPLNPRPAPTCHRRKPPSPAAHRDPGTHRPCPTGSPVRPQAPLFFELKAGGPATAPGARGSSRSPAAPRPMNGPFAIGVAQLDFGGTSPRVALPSRIRRSVSPGPIAAL